MNLQRKPSVVLDTNVCLDWLLFGNAGVAALVDAIASGHLRWLATAAMRDELAHMLGHSRLAHWPNPREQALASFDTYAELCPVATPCLLRCTDPDDQMFIDLAVAESVDWLLTRDRALLKLARRARPSGLSVLTPAAWCARDEGT
jgi:putative PIN family toxin of toxin-antitoxin system